MALLDRLEHLILGHFSSEPFDHEHRFFVTRNDQIEIAFFEIIERGKRHPLPVDSSESDAGYGAIKRQRGYVQRRGGPFMASTSPSFWRSLDMTKF